MASKAGLPLSKSRTFHSIPLTVQTQGVGASDQPINFKDRVFSPPSGSSSSNSPSSLLLSPTSPLSGGIERGSLKKKKEDEKMRGPGGVTSPSLARPSANVATYEFCSKALKDVLSSLYLEGQPLQPDSSLEGAPVSKIKSKEEALKILNNLDRAASRLYKLIEKLDLENPSDRELASKIHQNLKELEDAYYLIHMTGLSSFYGLHKTTEGHSFFSLSILYTQQAKLCCKEKDQYQGLVYLQRAVNSHFHAKGFLLREKGSEEVIKSAMNSIVEVYNDLSKLPSSSLDSIEVELDSLKGKTIVREGFIRSHQQPSQSQKKSRSGRTNRKLIEIAENDLRRIREQIATLTQTINNVKKTSELLAVVKDNLKDYL